MKSNLCCPCITRVGHPLGEGTPPQTIPLTKLASLPPEATTASSFSVGEPLLPYGESFNDLLDTFLISHHTGYPESKTFCVLAFTSPASVCF